MKYGIKDVIDFHVFNENGDLITKIHSSVENKLVQDSDRNTSYLMVKDALLDIDLLKFMSKQDSTRSDYEVALSKNKETVEIGGNGIIPCKIVGYGLARMYECEADVEFMVDIPVAQIVNKHDFSLNGVDPSEFDIIFQILPYNDQGTFYNLTI
ncbi:hypothetical protein [Paraliobacillus ryukyuensis]|uniref:hypothetical protein n=1 Tax=Paraliobacillus ryukyuensis TaxID=200904 RepID=UPI0009A683A6|nr:hypothetical protein [Paraliobacillus ryukyuensis]